MRRGRIIIKGARKGIYQLSGRIRITAQQLRNSKASFDSRLPGQKNGLNGHLVLKPGGIHHASHIQNGDHSGKYGLYRIHHGLLLRGKIEVSVTGNAFSVPSLPGKTVDDHHSRIRKSARRRKKLLWNFRLHRLSVFCSGCILLSHIFLIKGGKRIEYLHLSLRFLDFQTLINIAGVGGSNLSTSSAAPDIIDLSFAEYGQLRPHRKRKHLSFIFQKYHSFLRRCKGQGDMFLARRYASAVLSHGKAGLVCDSGPLFHFLFLRFFLLFIFKSLLRMAPRPRT